MQTIVKKSATVSYCLLLAALCLAGCRESISPAVVPGGSRPPRSTVRSGDSPIRLTDITKAAGIHFVHNHGGGGRHYFVEQYTGGCAFIDYDGDNWPDIFLVQAAPLPDYKGPRPLRSALYHNNRNGTFTDVTAGSGLDVQMYGMAAAVGDYDNDGKPDLFVTALGGNHLFHNLGNGKFRDVTSQAGVAGKDWCTSAVWLDYDNDGLLDLFVCRYTDYSLAMDVACHSSDGSAQYCVPGQYAPTQSELFHNDGNGAFTDVTRQSGIARYTGRSLGVIAADLNEDGWPDVYVANDQTGNLLFFNNGDGTFREAALNSGAQDSPRYGGMGVDCADYLNDGHQDIVVTNFSQEPVSLFRNVGAGIFSSDRAPSVLNRQGRGRVKWGIRFVDLDLDGYKDLFFVCGHINDKLPRVAVNDGPTFPQPAVLVRNEHGHFQGVSSDAGEFFTRQQVGRGAAFGDFNNDGLMDVLISCNDEPAILLRNDSPRKYHWIELQLEGSARLGHRGCNRDALGARVQVHTGSLTQTQWVHAGSYMSDHDRRLVFGIGQDKKAEVEIKWPCGAIQKVVVNAGQNAHINENACHLSKPGFHMPMPGAKLRSRS
jgi:hypothetical protein